MSPFKIVDRDEDVNAILNYIDELNKLSVIVIKSPLGVGKYAVVRKICEKKCNDYTIIDPSYISEDSEKIKGEYLYNIACELTNYYNKKYNADKAYKKYTFNYFFKKHKDSKLKYSIANLRALSENGISKASIFSVAINTVLRIFGSPLEDLDNDTKKQIMLSLGQDYIKYIFETEKIILVLRNVQFMDIESIRSIVEIANNKNNKSGIMLMTYDTDAFNSYSKYKTFLEYIKVYDRVLEYNLKSLPFNYVMDLLRSTLSNCIVQYEPYIFDLYNLNESVNLNFILDQAFNALTESNNTKLSINSSDSKFKYLTNTELFILSIIDIFGGSIDIELLIELYNNTFSIESNSILLRSLGLLVEKRIISKIGNNSYSFCHKLINSHWHNYISNDSPLNSGVLVAAKCCLDYCKREIDNYNFQDPLTIEHYIFNIIRIFSLYISVDLDYLCNCIEMISNRFSTTEDIWYCLEKMMDYIQKDKRMYLDVYFTIIDLCCDIELYKEALQIWNEIEEVAMKATQFECDRANFTYCKLYYLNEKYTELICFINSKIQGAKKNASLMYYYIFLIIALRATNKYNDIISVLNKIDEYRKRFTKTIQYGYFLRISETYKQRMEAIPDVEASVKVFEEKQLLEQKAKSLVSLSFLYSISGELDNAIQALDEAKIIFGNKYKNIIYNNEAVIYMLKGFFLEPTESLLRMASLLSNGNFSTAAIYSNQMIMYFELNNIPALMSCIKLTEKALEKIVDKHLIAVIAYNLYFVTKEIDKSKSQKYMSIAKKYCEHDNVLKKRISNQSPSTPVEHFLLKKPWHIVMLSFWEIDYLED